MNKLQQPYRTLSYSELEARGILNTEASWLLGPPDKNGEEFLVCLGEKEDCTWDRDGAEVVARLNEQFSLIQRLRKEIKLQDTIMDAFDG